MQRRRLLQLGLLGTAVLAVAGGTAALWEPGLAGGKLSPVGRRAMGALSAALLEGSLPEDPAALQKQLDDFEATVANFPPIVREELQLLLSLLVNRGGRLGLLGSGTALEELPRAELQALLQDMRLSKLAIRQQAYFALRDLNYAAFFAQPGAWADIGYPGPVAIE